MSGERSMNDAMRPGSNAALQGPVTDVEPDFLHALPMDNAVGAIVALTAEVWMLRERLATLEAELTSRRVLPDGAVIPLFKFSPRNFITTIWATAATLLPRSRMR